MSDVKELYSREAEENLLGAILVAPEEYYRVEYLSVKDFYIHRNGFVWQAIRKAAQNGSIDLVTVTANLKRADKLEEIGGPAYLTALISQGGYSYHATDYAKIIADYSQRRNALGFANEIAQAAYATDKEFNLADYLATAAEGTVKIERKNAKDAASEAIDMLLNPYSLTTGIAEVDRFIGGWFPDELSILAGYQGAGKSAMMIFSARKLAEAGRRVTLASLEMSAAQVWVKMACADLGVNPNMLRSEYVKPQAKQNVIDKATELGEQYQGQIVIYDGRMNPHDLMAAAMRDRPDIMFVDTLKNVAGRGKQDTLPLWYDFVVEYLRTNIAKRLHIHVALLHHLSRQSQKENREPVMQDLKYAGESDADTVDILHREGERLAGQRFAPIKWKREKARFGEVGSVNLNYDLFYQTFSGLHREQQEEATQ
jgi:replicative DNA helicase